MAFQYYAEDQPIQDAPPFPAFGPPEPQYDMGRQIMPSGYQPPEQSPVWQGSPSSEIDAANAAAPMNRVYGTAQDNAYLAEQRGQMMLDPRYAIAQQKMQIQAQEDAIRFAGQKEFEQLVSGGATPEEALRRTAGKLYYNHPDKLAMALSRVPAVGTAPSQLPAVPIVGPGGENIGHAVYGPGGKLHATEFTSTGKPPPDVVAGQKVAQGEMESLRRELNQARKDAAADPGNPDLGRRAATLQGQLNAAQQAFVQGSTNWMRGPAATAPPIVDFANPKQMNLANQPGPSGAEMIRLTKDGRRAIFDAKTKQFLRYVD